MIFLLSSCIIFLEVIVLKHNEMQIINYTKVYDAICQGFSTISEICSHLKIGHSSVSSICNRLVSLNIASAEQVGLTTAGRPKTKYTISIDNYCTFIQEFDSYFHIYSVNLGNEAFNFFEVEKYSFNVKLEDTLLKIKNRLLDLEYYHKFCRGIYINCTEETAKLLPKEFINFDFKSFSIDALSRQNKVVLLAFDGCNTLCIDKIVLDTEASIEEITKVFGEDNIKIYRTNLNIFNTARRDIIIKNMRDLLS